MSTPGNLAAVTFAVVLINCFTAKGKTVVAIAPSAPIANLLANLLFFLQTQLVLFFCLFEKDRPQKNQKQFEFHLLQQ